MQLTAETAKIAETDLERNRLNSISEKIIGAAIVVHQELGPGLLESCYEACLEYELNQAGLFVERQKPIGLQYRGVKIDCGFRIDLLVERSVVVELKAVEKLERIFDAVTLTYLKLTNLRLGLLLNFNVRVLKDGIKRLVLNFPE